MATKRKPTTALVPAAARLPELMTHEEADLNAGAIDTFVAAVGGRAQLTDVLSIAGAGLDMDKVTSLLLDPRYSAFSLKRLCTMAGVTVADLFASYRKALIVRAHIEATHLIASKLVPVVEDVMTRAAPIELVCPQCQGAASAGAAPCSRCLSTGRIRSEPDLDRQKLALELGQLTEKKGGIVVTQNANAIAAAALTPNSGALEQLQQAVGDLLFNPRRGGVTDADLPIDVPAPIYPREEEPPLPFDPPVREDPPLHRRVDLPGEPEECGTA